MIRPLTLALLAVLTLAAAPVATAAESVATYEHARHLEGPRWVLYSRHGDKQAALLDTDDGSLRALPVDGWRWPLDFVPVAEGKRRSWLYGIDNTGEEWILGRTDLEGGGNPEIIRRFPTSGTGRCAGWLRPGPDGTLLMAVQRDEGWMVDVFDPVAGAVRSQIGPLPQEPRFVTAWDRGRWLVVDGHGTWSWPDGERLYLAYPAAPPYWPEPPSVYPAGTPEWIQPRPDGSLLFGSWDHLADYRDGELDVIHRLHAGHHYPGEGPVREAALEYPADPVVWEGRLYLWEKGGQRLLRLFRDGEGGEWQLQTTWARPVDLPSTEGEAAPTGPELLERALGKRPGQHWLVDYRFALDHLDEIVAAGPDPAPLQEYVSRYWTHYGGKVLAAEVLLRTGHQPLLWRPDPPPATLDDVLEAFAATPWDDVAGDSLLWFHHSRAHELAIVEAHRAEAIPRLLEQRSASAAYTLALLGAEEADPWLRELVFDPTERGWESGCTYPRAETGILALQQLHQKDARDLIKITPAQRKRFRAAAAANVTKEGMDRYCGDGGHAALILSIYEDEED